MALTRLQKRLRKEAEEIADLAKVDFWNIEKDWEESEWRTVGLRIAIAHLVTAEIVAQYTLFDEILADYLCRYFFKKPRSEKFFYWKQKKFRLFVHYMLDEMYLLKKMQMVHAIRPLPKEVRETIRKVNAIRNAMAHSFFPENRKEYHKTGKVLYDGQDIRTVAGLRKFKDDCDEAYAYAGAMSADLLAHPAKLNAVITETHLRTATPSLKESRSFATIRQSAGRGKGLGRDIQPAVPWLPRPR